MSQSSRTVTMTAKELGPGLDEYLHDSFILNGTANSMGAIVVKNVPRDKLRKSTSNCVLSPAPFPICWTKGVPVDHVIGIFRLETSQRDEAFEDWVVKVGLCSKDGVDGSELESLLAKGELFGQQCAQQSSYAGLRSGLHLTSFPVTAKDKVFLDHIEGFRDLYGAMTSISAGGSIMHVRMAVSSLTTICFVHKGAPQNWIIIPPNSRKDFEDRVKDVLPMGLKIECAQFVRHQNLWIPPRTLNAWGIAFTEIKQHAQELMFIFPGSYYYGFSAGFNIIETKVYGGSWWKPSNELPCPAGAETCKLDQIIPDFRKSNCSPITQVEPISGSKATQSTSGPVNSLSADSVKRKASPFERSAKRPRIEKTEKVFFDLHQDSRYGKPKLPPFSTRSFNHSTTSSAGAATSIQRQSHSFEQQQSQRSTSTRAIEGDKNVKSSEISLRGRVQTRDISRDIFHISDDEEVTARLDLDKALRQNLKLQQDNVTITQELLGLRARKQVYKTECHELQAENKDLRAEIDGLQSTPSTLEDNTEQQFLIQGMQAEIDKLEMRVKNDVVREEIIQDLRTELVSTKTDITERDSTIQGLQAEVAMFNLIVKNNVQREVVIQDQQKEIDELKAANKKYVKEARTQAMKEMVDLISARM